MHLQSTGLSVCAISEITLYELYYGAYCSSNAERNLECVEKLKSWLTVIPCSDSFIEAAKQKSRLRTEGNLIEDFDVLIGCTAITSGRILVTDNVKHLERLQGVEIENWIASNTRE